jgi:putative spermidine/putrescine transport system permease protein
MKKAIVLALFIVFLLPFAYFLVASLATNYRFPLLLPESWTSEYWQQLFQKNNTVGNSILTSFLIATTTATLATSIGFGVSKTLAYHEKKRVFEVLSYLPYAFSPVIFAYCLNFFFHKSNLTGEVAGVILAQFLLTFPFAIILFLQHWNAELRAAEQLTYTLGGTVWQAFRRVLLPMSKPILMLCFFQTFLISWFEYGLTSVIGLGKVPTLTIKVYQFIGESNVYFAALASCLLAFPPLILWWVNRKLVFNQG